MSTARSPLDPTFSLLWSGRLVLTLTASFNGGCFMRFLPMTSEKSGEADRTQDIPAQAVIRWCQAEAWGLGLPTSLAGGERMQR